MIYFKHADLPLEDLVTAVAVAGLFFPIVELPDTMEGRATAQFDDAGMYPYLMIGMHGIELRGFLNPMWHEGYIPEPTLQKVLDAIEKEPKRNT